MVVVINIRGLLSGGYDQQLINNIEYITIATTGNAVDFGDLSVKRESGAECARYNSWILYQVEVIHQQIMPYNHIDFITIEQQENATDFGDLTLNAGQVITGGGSNQLVVYLLVEELLLGNSNVIDFINGNFRKCN